MRRHSLQLCAVLLAPISLFLSQNLSAAQTEWINPATGDWFNSGNWTGNQLPSSSIDAVISNGGTALLNSSMANAQQLFLGVPAGTGNTGTLRLGTAGVGGLTVASNVVVGGSTATGVVGNGLLEVRNGSSFTENGGLFAVGSGNQGSTGSVLITGVNTFFYIPDLTIGSGNSHGFWNLEGGALAATGATQIAATSGSDGTAVVTGTNSYWSLSNQPIDVGRAGAATLTISNNGVVANGEASVARLGGSSGSVTINSGGFWYSVYGLYIGGVGTSGVSGGNGSLRLLTGGAAQSSVLKVFNTSFVEVDNGSTTAPGLYIADFAPISGGRRRHRGHDCGCHDCGADADPRRRRGH